MFPLSLVRLFVRSFVESESSNYVFFYHYLNFGLQCGDNDGMYVRYQALTNSNFLKASLVCCALVCTLDTYSRTHYSKLRLAGWYHINVHSSSWGLLIFPTKPDTFPTRRTPAGWSTGWLHVIHIFGDGWIRHLNHRSLIGLGCCTPGPYTYFILVTIKQKKTDPTLDLFG